MKILIETIPHSDQRYPTCGDWQKTPEGLKIKVSNMSDERYCFLVAIHELIEAILCEHNHITPGMVDAFDIAFERERAAFLATGGTEAQHTASLCVEPGDDPSSPYKAQHAIATGIERILAERLGVDWTTYEKELNSL